MILSVIYFLQRPYCFAVSQGKVLYYMDENSKNSLNNYVKYSAIGFQMLATIGVFAYVGYRIDEKRQANDSLVTALLALLGTVAALYQVIRTLNKQKN